MHWIESFTFYHFRKNDNFRKARNNNFKWEYFINNDCLTIDIIRIGKRTAQNIFEYIQSKSPIAKLAEELGCLL